MKKKTLLFIIIICLLINTVFSQSVYRVYVGKKWLKIWLTAGWYRIRNTRGEILTARRIRDFIGIRIAKLNEDYDVFLKKQEYHLKRMAHNIESHRIIHIEGIKFTEFISNKLKMNDRLYHRLLITKKGNAVIFFRYSSKERKNFLRTLDEIDIIVSKFFRENFLD